MPVTVVDSRSIAMGLGFAAVSGARGRPRGRRCGPRWRTSSRRRATASSVYFYVDTLEYLRRGGRVSAARAAVGQALQVKPLLQVVDGHVTRLEQVRTAGQGARRASRTSRSPQPTATTSTSPCSTSRRPTVRRRWRPGCASACPRPRSSRAWSVEWSARTSGPGMVAVVVAPRIDESAGRRDAVTDLPAPVWWLIAAVVGYALGAINPAAIVARVFGVDLRSTGSGQPRRDERRTGARSAMGRPRRRPRHAQGIHPRRAVRHASWGRPSGEVAGLAAVVGHITSPMLKGRGGKGVATTLGAILGVQPLLAVPVLLAFGIGVAVWHRIGPGRGARRRGADRRAGSSGGAAGWLDEADMWFAVVLGMLVLVRHQRNLREAWASFRQHRPDVVHSRAVRLAGRAQGRPAARRAPTAPRPSVAAMGWGRGRRRSAVVGLAERRLASVAQQWRFAPTPAAS